MKSSSKLSYWGVDPALNHTAVVELNESGSLRWFNYVSETKKAANSAYGTHMSVAKMPDKQIFGLRRLAFWADYYARFLDIRQPTHVGVEDYVPLAEGNAEAKGEVGGALRMAALRSGALLRLHDPLSIKMWTAHNGAAKPEEVAEAVRLRWPETVDAFSPFAVIVQLDLFVAYAVAQMVLAESELRTGARQLNSFHTKEIQVWNRVTKANPTNLLSREWLQL